MIDEDDKVLKTLRAQAWERAKGELLSILPTYWEGSDAPFDRMDFLTKEFIKTVEEEGII